MATYTVQPGDTLSGIGAKFGVSYRQIIGYRSGNPNLIYPGEVLTVPDKPEVDRSAVAPSAPAAPTPGLDPHINPATGVWDDNYFQQQQRAGGAASFLSPAPIPNLTSLYDAAYKEAGISNLETELVNKKKALAGAEGTVNENPFLSEATRVGRIAKLRDLANQELTNLQNQIAMKKADVETKLNLQMKQLDINSQQSKDALSKFNTLLGLGVLDNASGEDIANITRATGIGSSMIQSAIAANKAKNVKSQVIQSTNDAGVVTVSVINSETGETIKQTSLGAIGNKKTPAEKKPSEQEQLTAIKDDLRNNIRGGITLDQAFALATGYLDPNEILRIYNANSPYGPAKEKPKELEKYGVK